MLLYQFPSYSASKVVDFEHGFFKTEALGFEVGRRLIERMATLEVPKLKDPLEMIKFICKDLWILLYRKQITSLKTNHRGTFVLQDTCFRPLSCISSNSGASSSSPRESIPFLAIPCGIIRGALFGLGMLNASVSAEVTALPQCTFHVVAKKSE